MSERPATTPRHEAPGQQRARRAERERRLADLGFTRLPARQRERTLMTFIARRTR